MERLTLVLVVDVPELSVHVLSFADRAGYQAYLDDPERVGHRTLLDGSPYDQRLLEVTDVSPLYGVRTAPVRR